MTIEPYTSSPDDEHPATREGLGTSHQLYLAMPQGVMCLSADGFLVRANPAAQRILGPALANRQGLEPLHRHWYWVAEDGTELPGPEHPAMQALQSGEPMLGRVVGFYHSQENEKRWLLVDAIPEIRGGVSRPFQVVVIFVDITERKLAEETLKSSEKRFRLVFKDSPDAMSITRLSDGMYVDINSRFTTLTGFGREETVGRTSGEMQIWHNPADRLQLVEKVRQDGFLKEFKAVFRRKDGSFGRALISARSIDLADVPHIIAVIRDITEKTEPLSALRASENLLSSILHTAPTAIGVVHNRIFLAVNEHMCTMTGYTKEELIGRNARMLYLSDADYNYVGEEKYRLIREHGKGTVEIDWKCKNGEVLNILLTSSPIDSDDPMGGTTFTALDISERKRAEAERQRLQGQLLQAQKMESVGRLAGGIAHDFNNMLGVILGHTELALNRLSPDQPFFAIFEEIGRAASHSADLARQLLTFARKQNISPKMIDLNETVAGSLKMLGRLIGENIDLVWLPGRDLGSVYMGPSQVDQILANLCVNSRDAITDTGKVTIETGVASFDEENCRNHQGSACGEYVVLTVSDNGCGMDAAVREHLFEPFFTTKETGKGTGLGLATTYGIVKQNKGFVDVCSELGQGASFRIYLPRHRAEAPAKPKEVERGSLAAGNQMILLVEDDAMILGVTTTMLETLGYRVLPAATPGEAVRLAAEHARDIDLLMTDVIMPEMNGRDLARSLLALHPRLRLLFMSGYTDDVIARQGVLDKGLHFIQKPFTMKDLAAKISEALHQQAD